MLGRGFVAGLHHLSQIQAIQQLERQRIVRAPFRWSALKAFQRSTVTVGAIT
jgi:hypothetical protein